MGFYLNHDSKENELPVKGKFDALIADGGTEVSGETYVDNMVAIKDNGPFDAAVYAYSEQEWEHFKSQKVRWLTHPKASEIAK